MKNPLLFILCLALILLSTSPLLKAQAEDSTPEEQTPTDSAVDPRIEAPKPEALVSGAVVWFECGALGKDMRNQPLRFGVKLPKNFDPTRSYPLMLILNGGDGENDPRSAVLTWDRDDLISVTLPYPDAARGAQHNMVGNKNGLWKVWKPMLKSLEQTFPNLDPTKSVAGGFSNGGHSLDLLMGTEEFTQRFAAFFFIEGGGSSNTSYRKLSGKKFYVAWGEKRTNSRIEDVAKKGKRAGMEVIMSVMKEIDHDFPPFEKDKVKQWIDEILAP